MGWPGWGGVAAEGGGGSGRRRGCGRDAGGGPTGGGGGDGGAGTRVAVAVLSGGGWGASARGRRLSRCSGPRGGRVGVCAASRAGGRTPLAPPHCCGRGGERRPLPVVVGRPSRRCGGVGARGVLAWPCGRASNVGGRVVGGAGGRIGGCGGAGRWWPAVAWSAIPDASRRRSPPPRRPPACPFVSLPCRRAGDARRLPPAASVRGTRSASPTSGPSPICAFLVWGCRPVSSPLSPASPVAGGHDQWRPPLPPLASPAPAARVFR